MLDEYITESDILNAIKELPNGKSPGTDGYGIEWYKFFWIDIKTLVVDSIQYAVHENKMSIEQKRAVLSLLPKQGKDIRFLKNWRPISLLNADYKILAKVAAKKMQRVIPYIINSDQSGCIKGRSTFSNIRSIFDIINYAEDENMGGILTFIDFEKAFDMVKWKFMFKCLEHLNFGKNFINLIKCLYNDVETCVVNNGHASPFFKPTRGIRQGCPASAFLFIIIAEVLANAIRANKRIRGIVINGKSYVLVQYADDTCLFLADEFSLATALIVLDMFRRCSGLRMNRDKSEAVWIGASSNFKHKPFGLKWTTKSVKYLGVYINLDHKVTVTENCNVKLDIIRSTLKAWQNRKLSIKGKVTIINSLIIPHMIYIGTVLEIPKWVIDSFNKIIYEYLWDGKTPKVKRSCIIAAIQDGGLKLQDLGVKIEALKIMWIKKIIDSEYDAPWKTYLQKFFKLPIQELPYKNMIKSEYPQVNEFYNKLFNTWAKLNYKIPQTVEDILRLEIWYNHEIKIGGELVWYKQWEDAGIRHVNDIFDNKGNIMQRQEIQEKYNIVINFLEYQSLVHAIPKYWKYQIMTEGHSKEYCIFRECTLLINEQKKKARGN
jgi:hypothetical protein